MYVLFTKEAIGSVIHAIERIKTDTGIQEVYIRKYQLSNKQDFYWTHIQKINLQRFKDELNKALVEVPEVSRCKIQQYLSPRFLSNYLPDTIAEEFSRLLESCDDSVRVEFLEANSL